MSQRLDNGYQGEKAKDGKGFTYLYLFSHHYQSLSDSEEGTLVVDESYREVGQEVLEGGQTGVEGGHTGAEGGQTGEEGGQIGAEGGNKDRNQADCMPPSRSEQQQPEVQLEEEEGERQPSTDRQQGDSYLEKMYQIPMNVV